MMLRTPTSAFLLTPALLLGAGLASLLSSAAAAAEDVSLRGAEIYRKLCLECHGERGEGVDDKAKPLRGSRDLASLADRIDRTMPEDDPDLCVGEDAQAVAKYMYDAFYSAEARAKVKPVRTELARLTVTQYRTSVADLVGNFLGGYGKPVKPERGLKARYFGTHNFGSKKEKEGRDRHEQTDARVRFDFGDGAPSVPEGKEFPAEEYSIRWEGVLLPEETGEYEFVVRTRNGVLLWVNDRGAEGRQLIDGWVAADNEPREMKRSLFLLGGRAYPIRMDFFKYKEAKGAVELLWKTPHGVLETLPERCLAPDDSHETLVVATPFPADDHSAGFERGTSVSKAWFEAATAGALEAATFVSARLDRLAGTKNDAPDRREKTQEFARRFVEAAFRRPLTEEQKQRHVDAFFSDDATPEVAIKRVAALALSSPRFLYPGLPHEGPPDEWDAASRLALALWDSVPDKRLQEAAAKGELKTPQQLESQARRLLEHARARAKVRGFFEQWLELERSRDLAKDAKIYPDYSEAVLSDLRTSLDLFLDEVVWSEASDYRQLMLADHLYLNDRLAKLYGEGQSVPGGNFQRVSLGAERRNGIITHPFLLASFSYHNNTSPIHRGVFLTRNVVGMPLNPPPQATRFEDSHFDPGLTMREKVTEMTRSAACMSCHTTINPLGFSLEHYDGIGRWRTKDKEKPVDPVSDFLTGGGETIQLKGARDVAEFAARAPSAHKAFLHQLFHHSVKQAVLAYGPDTLDRLAGDFERSGYSIRETLIDIAVVAAQGPEAKKPAPSNTASALPSPPQP